MGSKICMNENCRATTSPVWKKGWGFKSGGFATLCYTCGSAFENLFFCETFHLEESGWRECKFCGKRIHCGCIASKNLHDLLDFGGIGCISCINDLNTKLIQPNQIPRDDIPNGFGTLIAISNPQSSVVKDRMDGNSVDKGMLMLLSKAVEENQFSHFSQSQKDDPNSSNGQIKHEENMLPNGEVGRGSLRLTQQSGRSSIFSNADGSRPTLGLKDMYESLAQPSLSFSFSSPLTTPNSVIPFAGGVVEGIEKNKVPPFQQGQRARHILPKPPKSGLTGSQANKGMVSETRVARPPAEGRGRNQLLPRYWPRITDQELQQLSGDLNSTIVPLFEKVLSASDAGRIGRLVLPKACAEAYFPPISQSDGVPIRIQDIKGKEWTFQFRFWPNNNSRMYVLEGVTPCMQNMQLQAGDTVTFSRIDPGGQLVMGFRKATNPVDIQDAQTSTVPNGGLSGFKENLPTKNEDCGDMSNENSLQLTILIPEKKKKTQNIGSKSKRLLLHSEDAMELRITWEEAQELLHPPPSAKPTIVMVENHEFEEYDEPPVFGKRTIFTVRASGEQEQWAQCDSCSKWRSLPVDILLPLGWTCSDNIWDSNRRCSAPDEINPKKLENFFRASKDFKKRRTAENKVAQEREPSGLDALATAAVLGDNVGDSGEPSVEATTRHPRHRPGCTCIVCIQPPSGKGKHKPTCICNVCLTVKRRFRTLMLRRKKRQAEREAEIAQGKDLQVPSKDELETDGASGHALLPMNHSENERGQSGNTMEEAEISKGRLDLNCHPSREEDLLSEATGGLSMTTLVHAASLPLESLEMYLRQNGLPIIGPCLLSKAASESERHHPDEGCLSYIDTEGENKTD